MIATVMLFWV